MTGDKTAEVEETLRRIAARVLRKEDLVLIPARTFKEIGADSLDVVQIMVAIEETFDIELIDKDLEAVNNIGGFIAYVRKKVAEKKD
jgi:acyl carrier protein